MSLTLRRSDENLEVAGSGPGPGHLCSGGGVGRRPQAPDGLPGPWCQNRSESLRRLPGRTHLLLLPGMRCRVSPKPGEVHEENSGTGHDPGKVPGSQEVISPEALNSIRVGSPDLALVFPPLFCHSPLLPLLDKLALPLTRGNIYIK